MVEVKSEVGPGDRERADASVSGFDDEIQILSRMAAGASLNLPPAQLELLESRSPRWVDFDNREELLRLREFVNKTAGQQQ
jgi:hypothetical protein